MGAHLLFGAGPVAVAQRRQQGRVFFQRAFETVAFGQRGGSEDHQGFLQALHRVAQETVPSGVEQGRVKHSVQAEGLARIRGLGKLGVDRLQLVLGRPRETLKLDNLVGEDVFRSPKDLNLREAVSGAAVRAP